MGRRNYGNCVLNQPYELSDMYEVNGSYCIITQTIHNCTVRQFTIVYPRHTGVSVPLRCLYGINRSGTAMISLFRGPIVDRRSTAETVKPRTFAVARRKLLTCSAVPPQYCPRHTEGPVPLRCSYDINRSGTAMLAVVPQWFRH